MRSVHGASGCGHWVWSTGGGYTFYSIPIPLVSVLSHPYFPFNFCKLFFILVLVTF